MRIALAALTVLVMAFAISGIGMGESTAERAPAPSASDVAAAQQRIAAGGAAVARGRALFTEEGCDRCHALAAIDAGGKLGPRLDTLDEDLDDIVESIVDPRDDSEDGYPETLMPADYGQRIGDRDIEALAAFVVAASGSDDDDESGHGRGRGRGAESGRGRGRGGD